MATSTLHAQEIYNQRMSIFQIRQRAYEYAQMTQDPVAQQSLNELNAGLADYDAALEKLTQAAGQLDAAQTPEQQTFATQQLQRCQVELEQTMQIAGQKYLESRTMLPTPQVFDHAVSKMQQAHQQQMSTLETLIRPEGPAQSQYFSYDADGNLHLDDPIDDMTPEIADTTPGITPGLSPQRDQGYDDIRPGYSSPRPF